MKMRCFVTERVLAMTLATSRYGPTYSNVECPVSRRGSVARNDIHPAGREGADQDLCVIRRRPNIRAKPGYGPFFDLSDAQGAFGGDPT